MTKKPLSPELVSSVTASLQGYLLTPGRAVAVAKEVEVLNGVVASAAEGLRFEDEPASFANALMAGTQPRRTGR
jgi:hypothetical protein